MNTAEALNAAFRADPNAVNSLMCTRIPCNQALADDRFVQVDTSPWPYGHFQVGALGLVNAVLEVNNLPLVAAKFSDELDADGRARFLGFCEYVTEATEENG